MGVPLAERVRPKSFDEFVGQQKVVSVIKGFLKAGFVPSMIFYGPPGTGKTTLAEIVAKEAGLKVKRTSASSGSAREIRELLATLEVNRSLRGKVLLVVDEVHRLNKAQQDLLLPWVERGDIVFVGATTENPYFELVPALRSRVRIFAFEPFGPKELEEILNRAVEVAYGGKKINVEVLSEVIALSGGDARVALSTLETVMAYCEGSGKEPTPEVVRSLARANLLYYKGGDYHYDLASAFIKSVRGSDPDAAVYWLARMLEAGEDPRFIARRLLILASEDVGNADPLGVVIAAAGAYAADFVGLPEAKIILAQVATYLACAPKSNSAYKAISEAVKDVKSGHVYPVPHHLRDASYKGAEKLGHGIGYLYPHDFPGHVAPQRYLPEGFEREYYRPSDEGFEKKIKERLKRVREARACPPNWEQSRRENAS